MDITRVLEPDAIPSIDSPEFARTYFSKATDEAIVIEGEPAKAYPIRILHFHEIVNDTVDESPVAVTWCPLCASAVVYERTVAGRELTFGVSGKLADDDLVMYDRETGSEWKQSLGRAIAGPLEGTDLSVRPAPLMMIEAFRRAHPTGVILQPPGIPSEVASETDDPAPIDYDEDPYAAYFASEGFGLAAHRGMGSERRWERADLSPKTEVLGIIAGDTALGFPRPRVEEAGGVVRETIGDLAVLIIAIDAGMYAYADPGIAFRRTGDGLRGDGTTWNPVTGRAGDGRVLDRVPARRLFAATWQDDHGPDSFWSPAED